jgi:hypothetical protein
MYTAQCIEMLLSDRFNVASYVGLLDNSQVWSFVVKDDNDISFHTRLTYIQEVENQD